jgi:protein phosphatase PTC1
MYLPSPLSAKLTQPQLWDVCSDQEAVDLVRNQLDPNVASKQLVDHALARFSTDNLSCMIVRFDKTALLNSTKDTAAAIGVEGDTPAHPPRISEAEKLVASAKRKAHVDGVPGVGVSGSNSGKGHDPQFAGESDLPLRNDMEMEKVVEEEADEEGEDDEEEKESDINGAKVTASIEPTEGEESAPSKPAT